MRCAITHKLCKRNPSDNLGIVPDIDLGQVGTGLPEHSLRQHGEAIGKHLGLFLCHGLDMGAKGENNHAVLGGVYKLGNVVCQLQANENPQFIRNSG